MSIVTDGPKLRKRVVKSLSGNIIDLLDETNGGWIIRKGVVVNPKRYEEIQEEARQKAEAASLLAKGMSDPSQFARPEAPDRTVNPTKQDELAKRVDGMEEKLDKILEALKKTT